MIYLYVDKRPFIVDEIWYGELQIKLSVCVTSISIVIHYNTKSNKHFMQEVQLTQQTTDELDKTKTYI